MRNITVAGNTANGNGGGLDQYSATVDIANSLLTGNTGPWRGLLLLRRDAHRRGNNFVAVSAGQTWTAAGDISGNTATVVGPLADNGGATVLPDGTHPKTRALLTACTPANLCPIGNGNTAHVRRQPGRPWTSGACRARAPGRCDIGAFEVPPPPPNPLPPSQQPGGGGGAPDPRPNPRPSGTTGGAPDPLPGQR